MKSLFLLIVAIAGTVAPSEEIQNALNKKNDAIHARWTELLKAEEKLTDELNTGRGVCFQFFQRYRTKRALEHAENARRANLALGAKIIAANAELTEAEEEFRKTSEYLDSYSWLNPFWIRAFRDAVKASWRVSRAERNLNALLETDPEATVMSQAWSISRNRLIPGAGTCLAGSANVSIKAIREYVVPGAQACFSGLVHGCNAAHACTTVVRDRIEPTSPSDAPAGENPETPLPPRDPISPVPASPSVNGSRADAAFDLCNFFVGLFGESQGYRHP